MSELIQVTSSVWCFRQRSYFACSYIVAARQGVVLIDSGMSSDGAGMLKAIEKIGRDPRTIKVILLTHWHNDHAAGTRKIREVSAADVHYHANEAPYFQGTLARGGMLGKLADLVPELGPLVLVKGLVGNSVPAAAEATSYLSSEQVIFGDFEVIETPGHTSGHVCYYYRPEGVLFAGDAIAVVKGKLRCMARIVTPDIPLARASMQTCLNRNIAVICPGHREPLIQNVEEERNSFLAKIANTDYWPLLG